MCEALLVLREALFVLREALLVLREALLVLREALWSFMVSVSVSVPVSVLL